MKKIGTISSALGLIFLGVWMIVDKSNSQLAQAMFKWWPMIIIILGVEVIMALGRDNENQRVRFNGLIIFVVIIFLFVNLFVEVKVRVGDGIKWVSGNGIDGIIQNLSSIDNDNYRTLQFSKEFKFDGKNLVMNTSNAEINVKRSQDDRIKVEGQVYLNKDSSKDSYSISEKKNNDEYRIDMTEDYIRKVKLDLYVPEKIELRFNVSNIKLENDGGSPETKVEVNASNGSINLKNIGEANMKLSNGKLDIEDVKDIDIKSSNASIKIEGNAENIEIDSSNGTISVDNELCKNISIKASSGTVNFNTKDSNLDVSLDISRGTCNLNGEKRINAGLSKTLGNGNGKVKIDLSNGLINFKTTSP